MKRLAVDIAAFLAALFIVWWVMQYLALRNDVEIIKQEQMDDSQ